MLFFSSKNPLFTRVCIKCEFQSRNRDAFLFKKAFRLSFASYLSRFQSRNRDAFLFKSWSKNSVPIRRSRFNLVIEMLFFSSWTPLFARMPEKEFQSRNRDAFLFKATAKAHNKRVHMGFNLVIEMLFFSRFIARSTPVYIF